MAFSWGQLFIPCNSPLKTVNETGTSGDCWFVETQPCEPSSNALVFSVRLTKRPIHQGKGDTTLASPNQESENRQQAETHKTNLLAISPDQQVAPGTPGPGDGGGGNGGLGWESVSCECPVK